MIGENQFFAPLFFKRKGFFFKWSNLVIMSVSVFNGEAVRHHVRVENKM